MTDRVDAAISPAELEWNSLYHPPKRLPPLAAAALELAKEAHQYDHQTRRKHGHDEFPYYTHLHATLNILEKDHASDAILLAAAALHDAFEDCDEYLAAHATPEPENESREDTLKRLLEERYDEARQKSLLVFKNPQHEVAAVVELVGELTGENGLGIRKRVSRCLSALDYTKPAAKIRMAEQAASLADDIVMRSTYSRDEQLNYNDYVWAVAKAAMQASSSKFKWLDGGRANRLFRLVRHLHDVHRELLDFPAATLSDEEKNTVRNEFTLEKAFVEADKLQDWGKGEPAQIYATHPDIAGKQRGITEVGLTADGQITRVRILFEDGDNSKNDGTSPFTDYKITNDFTRAVEKDDPDNAVGYGKLRRSNGRARDELKLKLRKPVSFEKFVELAEESGMLDKKKDAAYLETLARLSDELKRSEEKQAGLWQR